MEKNLFRELAEKKKHDDEKVRQGVSEQWRIYDHPTSSFAGSFEEVTPGSGSRKEDSDEKFVHYIRRTLEREGKDLYAIELGGPASYLFSDFPPEMFKKTVGVVLADDRREQAVRDSDAEANHQVVEGNIFDRNLYQRISQETGIQKFDLIISRMLKGLRDVPRSIGMFAFVLRRWYSMLNENGLMFIQFREFSEGVMDEKVKQIVTDPIEDIIQDWIQKLQRAYPAIEIQMYKNAMRIHKKEGAPKELPIDIE